MVTGPNIAELKAHVERLEAENKRLRKGFADLAAGIEARGEGEALYAAALAAMRASKECAPCKFCNGKGLSSHWSGRADDDPKCSACCGSGKEDA